ncbi:MAG: hypothetical protein RJQ09_11480 [Cyclobacteriaceae bacterium]
MNTRIFTNLLIVSLAAGSFSCGDDNEPDTPTPTTETPDNRYAGLWNSKTESTQFNGVSISAILEVENNTYSGQFFISSNYTSCCGSGQNDGTISFIVEDDSVKNFVWNDIIPGCTGTFTGRGIVVREGSFKIDIEGTDCDGTHDGDITLSKQI